MSFRGGSRRIYERGVGRDAIPPDSRRLCLFGCRRCGAFARPVPRAKNCVTGCSSALVISGSSVVVERTLFLGTVGLKISFEIKFTEFVVFCFFVLFTYLPPPRRRLKSYVYILFYLRSRKTETSQYKRNMFKKEKPTMSVSAIIQSRAAAYHWGRGKNR